MVTDAEFAALRRDMDHIKDRMAIYDRIASHAHGHDRHDSAIITAAYHDDGVDEHGPYVNPAPNYADWVNAAHEGMSVHTHNITTHRCEIDGDVAHAESYVIVCILSKDEKSATFASGRYVDRLEKRNGEWRIMVRRTINEVTLTGDASWIHSDDCKGYPKGEWSERDLAYRRPLDMAPPERLW